MGLPLEIRRIYQKHSYQEFETWCQAGVELTQKKNNKNEPHSRKNSNYCHKWKHSFSCCLPNQRKNGERKRNWRFCLKSAKKTFDSILRNILMNKPHFILALLKLPIENSHKVNQVFENVALLFTSFSSSIGPGAHEKSCFHKEIEAYSSKNLVNFFRPQKKKSMYKWIQLFSFPLSVSISCWINS